MIYTITFNPAIDYIVEVDKFTENEINRTTSELILPGGKGINVSIVLKNLGVESTALGFIAGFTGKELERILNEQDITTDFIELDEGFTRINTKILSSNEIAINGNGPDIKTENIDELFEKLDDMQSGDILVLSGSIPKTMSNDIYEKICKHINNKEIKTVVDATGELLLKVLEYKPFLIKPNVQELEETFKVKISSRDEIIEYAKKLQEIGAKNVLISMGGDGAILVNENNEVIYSSVPKIKMVNTVGAGDSMVAGFIVGYLNSNNYNEALKMGVATGSASASSKYLATKEEVFNLLKNI